VRHRRSWSSPRRVAPAPPMLPLSGGRAVRSRTHLGRRIAALSAAAAVLLLSTGGASAALGVRLSIIPTAPRVGQSVSVLLRPYFPYVRDDGTCCRLVPADVKDYRFRVEATSPAGRVFRIAVGRTIDPFLWRRICLSFGRSLERPCRVPRFELWESHADHSDSSAWCCGDLITDSAPVTRRSPGPASGACRQKARTSASRRTVRRRWIGGSRSRRSADCRPLLTTCRCRGGSGSAVRYAGARSGRRASSRERCRSRRGSGRP
jgi:hypothetical protein